MTLRSLELSPYFADVRSLKGVGPKLAQKISSHIGQTVRDVIFFLPHSFIERPFVTPDEWRDGEKQSLEIEISDFQKAFGKLPARLIGHSNGVPVSLVFFQTDPGLLSRNPIGSQRYASGNLERFRDQWQMTHPDYLVHDKNLIPKIEPIYAQTEGLSSRQISKIVQTALDSLTPLKSLTQHDFGDLGRFNDFFEKLRAYHLGQLQGYDGLEFYQKLCSLEALCFQSKVFDEILSLKHLKALSIGPSIKTNDRLKATGLTLTRSQIQAMDEIRHDLKSGHVMHRFIQGDVGSGKTLVAFCALSDAYDAGHQAVMMAPTEVLATQLYEKARQFFHDVGDHVYLLTASTPLKQKKLILAALASSHASLLFCTHAGFQDQVSFGKLALCIIDEHHRFGIDQRKKLLAKGDVVHQLCLSATPIPRSLILTMLGAMDISVMTDKPANRIEIKTTIMNTHRLDDVYERLEAALKEDAQIYWVCPAVEENDALDIAAVSERFKSLSERFQNKVSLIHGKLNSAQKDQAFLDFISKKTNILCATSVIEVGVDVPNATIMIIENAERFGLAQLHQLRGRVGRSNQQSYCILIYQAPLSDIAKQRLMILKDTDDGFLIAEEDLRLRGEGDLHQGLRQSGASAFHFLDPVRDYKLMLHAQKHIETLKAAQKSDQKARVLEDIVHLMSFSTP